MVRTIILVITVVLGVGYLLFDISQNWLTKEHLVQKASIIGVADITAVNCSIDGCGEILTLNPVTMVKGNLPKGAEVSLKKG